MVLLAQNRVIFEIFFIKFLNCYDVLFASGPPTRLSCTVVGAQVEFRNGYPVNCLTADCSQGYYCEYNKFYNQGQYICCGELPGTYGKNRTAFKT